MMHNRIAAILAGQVLCNANGRPCVFRSKAAAMQMVREQTGQKYLPYLETIVIWQGQRVERN